eukprot:2241421-Rhodomonas_salina.1
MLSQFNLSQPSDAVSPQCQSGIPRCHHTSATPNHSSHVIGRKQHLSFKTYQHRAVRRTRWSLQSYHYRNHP